MYEQKRCILIADDEARICRALGDLLAAQGFHVLTAGDGRAALAAWEQHREQIDLALLDVMMPELDGFAVLREIRGQDARLPVILPLLLLRSRPASGLLGLMPAPGSG